MIYLQKKLVTYTWFIIIVLANNPLNCYSQISLIHSGSTWSYYDQGSLDNTNWKDNAYSFEGWSAGTSELGYGDGDESNVIGFGNNSSNKHITSYFKKKLNTNSAAQLDCQIKMDDGGVVYLNGIEVFRKGMPSGNISFNTLALGNVDENAWYSFVIPAALVLNGENTISVEIHQSSALSSDLTFDFKLTTPIPPPAPGIYINEVLASNQAVNTDNNNQHSDWIEIFNNTNTSFDLSNRFLSDNKSNLKKFQFANNPGELIIPPMGHKLLWASGNVLNGPSHLPWSLSKDGEFVALTDIDGITVIDSLSFTKQRTDISYGRFYEKIDSMVYFSPASPGLKNPNQQAFAGIMEKVNTIHEAGFYESSFLTSIQYSEPNSSVFYSLDGSDPKSTNVTPKTYELKNHYPQEIGEPLYDLVNKTFRSFSFPYNGTIPVSSKVATPNYISNFSTVNYRYPYQPSSIIPKATVIRAVNSKIGFIDSEILTKTFFLFDRTSPNNNVATLPVISLTSQEDNFYEYRKGIMTPGSAYDYAFKQSGRNIYAGNYMFSGKSWERPGNFEMFMNNSPTVNENVDLRIHGNSSRLIGKKSFRIYFGNPNHFFQKDQSLESDVILLKTPSSLGVPTHDLSMRIMSKLNIPIQNTTPVITYINGEYWGIYNILEYINEEFLEKKYGVPLEKLDVYKDSRFENGTKDAKNALTTFLKGTTFASQTNYDSLSALVDLESLIDLFASQIFSNNKDWPVNNTFLWRYQNNSTKNTPKSALDGRWRWILIDFDGALNYVDNNAFLRHVFNDQAFESLLFRKALENSNFKNAFINRLADLLNSHFNYNRTSTLLTDFINEYNPELQKDYARWDNQSPATWNSKVNAIYGFLQNRIAIVRNQIQSHFNIGNLYTLTISVADTNQGFVKVNSIDIKDSTPGISTNPTSWNGTYFGNIPLIIKAKPKLGYKFKYWIKNGQYLMDSVLSINLNANEIYSAVFEETILSNNPFPQSYLLKDCSYKFFGWSANSQMGTFPSNMAFCYFNNMDPTLSSTISGYVNGSYNNTTKSRINGLNENGFSFINTNSDTENPGFPNARLGGAILALNTLDIDSVKISWKARTIKAGNRKYAIRLQYREGDILPFKDFTPPVTYQSSAINDDSTDFTSQLLPSTVTNKPYIQLIWKYYFTEVGNSGTRDQLGIDDILITTYKKINEVTENFQGNNLTYNYYYISNNVEGPANINFENAVIIQPGTTIDKGHVIKIEKKVCSN